MTLFEQWQDLIDNQTDESFEKFWELYSSTEKKIYSEILDNHKATTKGTFKELAEKFEADPIIFMGFLDGINTSLNKEMKLEDFTEDSSIKLDIDYERLYFNMLEAKADYLYTLPQWEDILSEDEIESITKEHKKSKTVVKEKIPGRNDPCSCGSGKKYKKCCGAI